MIQRKTGRPVQFEITEQTRAAIRDWVTNRVPGNGQYLFPNFHMRNGITPVVPLRAAGVNVAMGLDDKTINDDEDAVMELRIMHKVHRLHTFDLETPALTAYEVLEIATLNGAKATGFADEVGALVPGMKGDAILADLDRVARDPWIDPEFDITDAFVERAMGADVATVVIGGKIVVEDHQPRTIDLDGLYREVRAFCAKGLTPEQRAHADYLRKIKPLCPGVVRYLARDHARPAVLSGQ